MLVCVLRGKGGGSGHKFWDISREIRAKLAFALTGGGGELYNISLYEAHFTALLLIMIAQSLKGSSTEYLARS